MLLLLAVLLAVLLLLLLLLCLVLVVLSRTLGEMAMFLKGEDGEVDDDALMGEEGMHFLLLGDSVEERNLLGDIMLGEASSEGGGGGGVIIFLDKK
jgi:hypothetical protein